MALISINADGTIVALSAGVRNRTPRAGRPEVSLDNDAPVTRKSRPSKETSKDRTPATTKVIPRPAKHTLPKPGKEPVRNTKPRAKESSGLKSLDSALIKHPYYEEAMTDLREKGIDVFSTKGRAMLKDMLADRDSAAEVRAPRGVAPAVNEVDRLQETIATKISERADILLQVKELEKVDALTVEQENNLNKLRNRLVSVNSYLNGARKHIANIRKQEKK